MSGIIHPGQHAVSALYQWKRVSDEVQSITLLAWTGFRVTPEMTKYLQPVK
ncbi:hypothetical protein [Nitrosospira briensis]|uniref:hypothetical protein n=1 Tax=Nitrosospira briensis TaxID=35799 RepID=UPI0015A6BF9C|nr:hypothetical protein [Nitrosospira briensis]